MDEIRVSTDELHGPFKVVTLGKEWLVTMLTTSVTDAFFTAKGIPPGADIINFWVDERTHVLHILLAHPQFEEVEAQEIDDLPAIPLDIVGFSLSSAEVLRLKDQIDRLRGRSAPRIIVEGRIADGK